MDDLQTNSGNFEYGQLAVNKNVNESIYRWFEIISSEDKRKFVTKFREQAGNDPLFTHTYRELVLGAYLGTSGFRIGYERGIDKKTPDWCILDNEANPTGVVELTNFHSDMTTEDEMETAFKARGIWMDWTESHRDDNAKRLYHVIWQKAGSYKEVVKRHDLGLVIGVFGIFSTNLDRQLLEECLLGDEGLFSSYPELSGALLFSERGNLIVNDKFLDYKFEFLGNPKPSRELKIPDGCL